MIKQARQRIEEAVYVQASARLVVNTKLGPGEHFAQLFKSAQAAWQGNKRVRKLGHQCFSLVHRADDPQIGDSAVSQLAIDKHLRAADWIEALGRAEGMGGVPSLREASPGVRNDGVASAPT